MSVEIRCDAPLAPYTTIGVGGPADVLVEADHSREGITQALEAAADQADGPVRLLGSASNVVISDAGLRGVSVLARGGNVRRHKQTSDGTTLVEVDGGMDWDRLVAWSVAEGLGGIELLSGIPGTVGAAPVQNIGAYGQALDQVLVEVALVDRADGRSLVLPAAELGLAYRDSHFKGKWRDGYAIVSVVLELAAEMRSPITYRDLELFFSTHEQDPGSLTARREAVLSVRRGKSMVHDASDPLSRSCGSFFVSPRLPRGEAVALVDSVRGPGAGERLLSWYSGADAERFKVPAAMVLLAAGFANGDRWGDVGLSPRHVLALVNHGGAMAQDVHDVAEHVRATVRQRLDIALDCEPRFLGEFTPFDPDAFAARLPFVPGAEGTPTWAANVTR